jgi:hypothetical protein
MVMEEAVPAAVKEMAAVPAVEEEVVEGATEMAAVAVEMVALAAAAS